MLCPILFLTARVDEDDKINGLLSGGDDYITKPFSLRELEARIVTNIKREERHQQKTKYRFMDEMLIDYSEKIVAIAGHRICLLYTSENFTIQPEGDGAFICKNSWGEEDVYKRQVFL